MITTEEIKRRLWDGANELRGSMDASRYKDYMLGLMFYKFLSDKTLATYKSISGSTAETEAELIANYQKDYEKAGAGLTNLLQSNMGYYVLPEFLYQQWLLDISSGEFEVSKVTDSLNHFERTIAVQEGADDFKGLFSGSTLDLSNTALGSSLNERNRNIKALILLFADLNMVALQKGDVLGDSYEYLIGKFAMESGAKAGEFYTPKQVSEVMAQIVSRSKNITSIYDPTVGSGSLLLNVKKHLSRSDQRDLEYYGQEKNTATYNLTRMNLLLHGVKPDKMTIRNGDTLSKDWPEDPSKPNQGILFDAVVMNPPYSAKNWNREELKVSDPRFETAGVLPPDSKGDYAFLLHGLYHLGTEGTMAIVLPHGVLFRGGTEGDIRERLLNKNYIDTVIGLPSNLFTNTGIPVCIIILKKNRPLSAPVLLIDASKEFIKVGKQNELQEKDIAKITDTYVSRATISGYSYLASREDIIENEYNLNLPRYVETMESEIPQDVEAHLHGGVPQANLETLIHLNQVAKESLAQYIKPLRPGYITVTGTKDEVLDSIKNSPLILEQQADLTRKVTTYLDKWWNSLIELSDIDEIRAVRENMLVEIKELLADYPQVDAYLGYQIISDCWFNHLQKDAELIAASKFHELGRKREARMVSRGSGKNKRQEQDGWTGVLVPNELIKEYLYQEENNQITELNRILQEIESSLAELVEAAKVEDSQEEASLLEALNEKQDAFQLVKVKALIKEEVKSSDSYELLHQVQSHLTKKASTTKKIRAAETELNDTIEQRILTLTDEEIDQLIKAKWFNGVEEKMTQLLVTPLNDEIDILFSLEERYNETLEDLDKQLLEMESSLNSLLEELEVL